MWSRHCWAPSWPPRARLATAKELSTSPARYLDQASSKLSDSTDPRPENTPTEYQRRIVPTDKPGQSQLSVAFHEGDTHPTASAADLRSVERALLGPTRSRRGPRPPRARQALSPPRRLGLPEVQSQRSENHPGR